MIRIGSLEANVSFAGLAGAGLYQFNVEVPELAAGEYTVTAEIGGTTSATAVKLAIG